jgi:hypothetical protein
VGAAEVANAITWWESDGASPPNFTEHNIDNDFPVVQSVFAIDLNGDSNVNILGAAWGSNTIAWWEKARHDVGPISIDIPDTVQQDTTFQPQATIGNFGNITEDGFLVTCKIEPGGYIRYWTLHDFLPYDTTQVTFLMDFTFESGPYTVTVYTNLDDEDPSNDTLEKVIETYDFGITEGNAIPLSFSFSLQNNPIKGTAMFALELPKTNSITLNIYDISGRLVDKLISGRMLAGYYQIPWTQTTPGVYFYKIESPWENKVGKLVVVH